MADRITVYLIWQGGPYFQGQWVDSATKRHTRSLKTANETEARKRAGLLEERVNAGDAPARGKKRKGAGRITWADFVARYESDYLGGKRATTIKVQRSVLRVFGRINAPAHLADVNAAMIARHARIMRENGRMPSTVVAQLMVMQTALTWAHKREFIARVPLIDMPALPRKVEIRTVDEAGYQRLRKAALTASWRLLIDLGWYTGMRRAEMLALRWDNAPDAPWVDLASKRIWLPAASNKANADQWIPIHEDLATLLRAAMPAKATGLVLEMPTIWHVWHDWHLLSERAGLPEITMHDLRKSFAMRYAAKVPAQVLQRLMRHANIATTLKYYTNLDKAVEEAIALA